MSSARPSQARVAVAQHGAGGACRPQRHRMQAVRALLAAAVWLIGAGSCFAHHAFSAEFDADKPIDIDGIVTKARWVNPHSWLYFDVKGADGTVTNWGVEFGAPFALQQQGLTKTVLPAGTHVHVKGYRSKNGGPFGYAVTVSLDDGRSFKTGGAQDSPTAAASAPR